MNFKKVCERGGECVFVQLVRKRKIASKKTKRNTQTHTEREREGIKIKTVEGRVKK